MCTQVFQGPGLWPGEKVAPMLLSACDKSQLKGGFVLGQRPNQIKQTQKGGFV